MGSLTAYLVLSVRTFDLFDVGWLGSRSGKRATIYTCYRRLLRQIGRLSLFPGGFS